MKRMQILPIALLLMTVIMLTSCAPGREYYAQSYPRYHNSFSLVITPSPGFVINRYPDGRYYYRSPEGYIYWRGYDNRYYIDRSHLGYIHYDQRQYDEWKRYDRGYHSRRHR